MGWNSWNCFASAVTEKNVRDAADAFVKAGLRDHGWTYINIDDFWMPKNDDKDATLHGPDRDSSGKINSNPRFPDMKSLTDHIHSLGLKVGIYSSPGPKTCGGCVASYKHEKKTPSGSPSGALITSSTTGAVMVMSRKEPAEPTTRNLTT